MNREMIFRTLSISLLAAGLSGCRSIPVPEAASVAWVPPAEARTAKQTRPEPSAQKPDPTRQYTLADVAEFALRNQPAARAAWNDARAAAAQVQQARGMFMPEVTATAGASRQWARTDSTQGDKDQLLYGPGLKLNYTVFNFGGGYGAAVEQALQTVYAANHKFNQTLQDSLLAVEIAYYQQVGALAAVEAAEVGVKDAQAILDSAVQFRDSGLGTELEVLQAQAGLDRSRYGLAEAQGALQSARGKLAQTMGLPADTCVTLAPSTNGLPEEIHGPDLRRMIDAALERRPDLAAQRAQLAAAEADVRVKDAAAWPSLNVTGGINRNYVENYRTDSDSSSAWDSSIGASLSWTVFDGFQTVAERRTARAKAESARARLEQAELAAGAEVWNRYQAYETARQKYVSSAAFSESAAAAYAAALQSYKAGLKSFLDLLNSETQVAQARSLLVAARQEMFVALVQLAHATGLLEAGGAEKVPELLSTPSRKDPQS